MNNYRERYVPGFNTSGDTHMIRMTNHIPVFAFPVLCDQVAVEVLERYLGLGHLVGGMAAHLQVFTHCGHLRSDTL